MQNPTTEGLSLSMFESQYDAYLLTVRGLSRSTRSLHHHVVHKLLSSRFPIGYISWSEIRFNDFVQFLTSEFARLHNRWTQTTWLMILRSLLRYLSREGHLPLGWDAALPAIVTRKHTSLPRGVSQEQVRALWAASEGRKLRNLRDRALLPVFLRLGLRAEEVANIYVQLHGKGRRDRSIPLWPRTARVLRDWFRELEQSEQAMAFPSTRGEPLTRFAIHLLLRKAVERASSRCTTLKKKRVSPHVVRHGTAMALLQSGVDIAVIALWLGHESIETTNVYLHANLAMKEKALAKVAPIGRRFRRFRANDHLLALLESL